MNFLQKQLYNHREILDEGYDADAVEARLTRLYLRGMGSSYIMTPGVILHYYPPSGEYLHGSSSQGSGGSPIVTVDAYWTFEELTIQYVDKVSGILLQPSDHLDTVTGKIGNGARLTEFNQFGGTNTQQVSNAANNLIYTPGTSKGINVFFWINYSEFGTDEPSALINSYGNGWKIEISTIDDTTLWLQLTLQSTPTVVTLTSESLLNTWTFVAFTWDATTKVLKIYINGTLVSTTSSVNGPAGAFDFGQIQETFGSTTHIQDNFIIDELGIAYSVGAYTQAQITALYNSGAGKTWPLT